MTAVVEIIQLNDRSLSQALYDSTLELLNEAIQRTTSKDAHSIESVHRELVIMKKLRGHQQLIRPLIPERSLGYANQRIKKAANLLSGQRDKDVLMKTHLKLVKKSKNKKTTKSLNALEVHLDEVRVEDTPRIAWSKVRSPIKVEQAFWTRQFEKRPLKADDYLIQGLASTYEKARNRFKSAYKDKDRNRYHDWRKWTKYLMCQFEFFSDQGERKHRKHIKALTQLGKFLGNHQDLQIYRKYIHQVSAHDFSSDQLARCDVLIRQNEKALESKCKKIGNQWFREKPSQFEKRMWKKCLSKKEIPASMPSFNK
ncbi:MAG: CHAD domain-containing protein [Verrucomicrobia bacterium]|nr:CHAD domain-containing protein [Verrucomicrobiota bacterium]